MVLPCQQDHPHAGYRVLRTYLSQLLWNPSKCQLLLAPSIERLVQLSIGLKPDVSPWKLSLSYTRPHYREESYHYTLSLGVLWKTEVLMVLVLLGGLEWQRSAYRVSSLPEIIFEDGALCPRLFWWLSGQAWRARVGQETSPLLRRTAQGGHYNKGNGKENLLRLWTTRLSKRNLESKSIRRLFGSVKKQNSSKSYLYKQISWMFLVGN